MIKGIKNVNIFSDYSYISFVISCVLTVTSVAFSLPFLMLAACVLMFSSMDSIGYFHLVWGGDQTTPVKNQEQRLVSYRFIQTVFQVLVSLVLYSTLGLNYVAAFNTMWWFGLCDLLYYVLLKQNFLDYEDMFWLWWTPLGMLKSIGAFRKTITGKMMILQAMVGIVVGLLFIL